MDVQLMPWMVSWDNTQIGFWHTREWAEEDARQMIAEGSRGVIVAQVVMQSVDDGGTEVLQPIEVSIEAKNAEAAIVERAKATPLPTIAQVVEFLRAAGFEPSSAGEDGSGLYTRKNPRPVGAQCKVVLSGLNLCPDLAMSLPGGYVPGRMSPQYFMVETMKEIAYACGLSHDQWADVAYIVSHVKV